MINSCLACVRDVRLIWTISRLGTKVRDVLDDDDDYDCHFLTRPSAICCRAANKVPKSCTVTFSRFRAAEFSPVRSFFCRAGCFLQRQDIYCIFEHARDLEGKSFPFLLASVFACKLAADLYFPNHRFINKADQ